MSQEGDAGRADRGPHPQVREARLRPEFAYTYPRLSSDVWYLASSILAVVRGRLPDAHFEFRGDDAAPRSGARTRISDRAGG